MATTMSQDVRSTSLFDLAIGARDRLGRFPTSILALAFRLAVATVFFRSGMTKLASWDATVALFDMEYMVPILPAALAAYLATAIELGCLGAADRSALAPASPRRRCSA